MLPEAYQRRDWPDPSDSIIKQSLESNLVTPMPSAGELLRTERLKRNRSLSEIAAQTRISKRYLEAIEADEIKELPGDFFYKAFLRQYASALALDPETTDEIVSSALPVSEPDPVPALNQAYERAHSADSARWRPSTLVAGTLLVGVIAGGSLLYSWWQRAQTREASVVTAPAPPPAQTEAEKVAPAPVEEPTPQPEAPTAAASFQPPLAVAPGQTAIYLNATEPAWVQLSADGTTVFTGTLEPGQPRQFAVSSSAKLITGNAGGLEMQVNGKAVGPIGPRGHIRTVLIQNGGFEILAPRPKSKPAEEQPPATSARISGGQNATGAVAS